MFQRRRRHRLPLRLRPPLQRRIPRNNPLRPRLPQQQRSLIRLPQPPLMRQARPRRGPASSPAPSQLHVPPLPAPVQRLSAARADDPPASQDLGQATIRLPRAKVCVPRARSAVSPLSDLSARIAPTGAIAAIAGRTPAPATIPLLRARACPVPVAVEVAKRARAAHAPALRVLVGPGPTQR